MTCVEAKALGARTVLAVVAHADYAGVVGNLGISEVVSPYEVIERQAIGFTHTGALVYQNSTLLNGTIEVLELEVGEGSLATRGELKTLAFPKPSLVAGVIRDNLSMIPYADFQFQAGDEVVAFVDSANAPAFVDLFESESTLKSRR